MLGNDNIVITSPSLNLCCSISSAASPFAYVRVLEKKLGVWHPVCTVPVTAAASLITMLAGCHYGKNNG